MSESLEKAKPTGQSIQGFVKKKLVGLELIFPNLDFA